MAKRLKKESKFHKFVKEHFMIVVMIAIMLIPSIYTVLFLGSMWDPYGNTGSLPVAIVNQDEAVSYNGKTLNVGEQLCDNLKENDSLKFNFVDEKVALDGLENGTYYNSARFFKQRHNADAKKSEKNGNAILHQPRHKLHCK